MNENCSQQIREEALDDTEQIIGVWHGKSDNVQGIDMQWFVVCVGVCFVCVCVWMWLWLGLGETINAMTASPLC